MIKILYKAAGVIFLTVALFSCSAPENNSVSDAESETEAIKGEETLAFEKQKWEERINKKIEDIESRLKNLEGDYELEQAKIKLENSLDKIKEATDDNWKTIEGEISDTYSEVKTELNRIAREIEKAVSDM